MNAGLPNFSFTALCAAHSQAAKERRLDTSGGIAAHVSAKPSRQCAHGYSIATASTSARAAALSEGVGASGKYAAVVCNCARERRERERENTGAFGGGGEGVRAHSREAAVTERIAAQTWRTHE